MLDAWDDPDVFSDLGETSVLVAEPGIPMVVIESQNVQISRREQYKALRSTVLP